MKASDLPTLEEIRSLLGEELYVAFVWMWREREQDTRAAERCARFASLAPRRTVETWPTPAFTRQQKLQTPVASTVNALKAAFRVSRGSEGEFRNTGT